MLLRIPTTPSTMAEARRLLDEGDTRTTIVLADTQTSGRGRQGASWVTFSAPHGMAATFIVRESQPIPHLALIVSLALHQTLNLPGLAIKWPNDVLLHGKKAAGILCEALPDNNYLIGTGLNLSQPPGPLPEDFPGTFLGTTETEESLAKRLSACIFQLIQLYKAKGWSALHNNYLRACSTIGQPARWKRSGKQDLTGIARGLTKDGHLELETADGQTHIIHSGEIVEATIPNSTK